MAVGTMRALVYQAHDVLELADVPEPDAGPGEQVLHVAAVGICGSELEGFATHSPVRVPPLIMGHEIVGVAADGRRVAVNPLVSCGTCDLCARGRRNLCRHRAVLGIHRPGGYAELVVAPAANVYELPAGISREQGALVEPLANAVHAVRLAVAGDDKPHRLGIIGAGALGVACTIVAAVRGVGEIMVADRSADRRALVRQAGATTAVADLVGEFDVIIDAVGSGATRAGAVGLLRPGGTAVWVGLFDGDPGFDPQQLVRQEKRVLGTFCYEDRDFAAAVPLADRIDPAWIDAVPLDDGVAAFRRLLEGPSATIKTVLVP